MRQDNNFVHVEYSEKLPRNVLSLLIVKNNQMIFLLNSAISTDMGNELLSLSFAEFNDKEGFFLIFS